MILLVEDNKADVKLIEKGLEQFKVNFHIEDNGESAIEYLKTHKPRMVILDLNLFKVSGKEVLEFIKTSPRLKNIPVIMYSTSVAPEDIEECYRLGANAYLCKPFKLQDTFALLEALGNFWFKYVE